MILLFCVEKDSSSSLDIAKYITVSRLYFYIYLLLGKKVM